jgi:DnaJ-class molecular chaperone
MDKLDKIPPPSERSILKTCPKCKGAGFFDAIDVETKTIYKKLGETCSKCKGVGYIRIHQKGKQNAR